MLPEILKFRPVLAIGSEFFSIEKKSLFSFSGDLHYVYFAFMFWITVYI